MTRFDLALDTAYLTPGGPCPKFTKMSLHRDGTRRTACPVPMERETINGTFPLTTQG